MSWLQAIAAVFSLLAVLLQSFVVQTHIHAPQRMALTRSIAAATAVPDVMSAAAIAKSQLTPIKDKYPISGDPLNCPLCQEITHSGQFIHSAAALATIPASVAVHFIPRAEALPSRLAVSHSWHGRAPPSA